MVRTLTAAHFHRFMTSGRTHPMLCGCEDEAGEQAGDFVVKLRGGMERGDTSALYELVGALLAQEFGLSVPEPALVVIEEQFAEQVAAAKPQFADQVRKSSGLNFGCMALTDVIGWPVDKSIPDAMRQTAVDIFAFDALIQNPDRRFNNQNLLTRGNEIFVFDHEVAFSFVVDILLSRQPWKLDGQRYLAEHVFYRQLRSKPIELEGFLARLGSLPKALARILNEVPAKWNNGDLEKIHQHLRSIAGHAQQFGDEIRRALA